MNKVIKYFGHYDTYKNNSENRIYSLAATTKMDYICSALNKCGYDVLIVSPSRTFNNKFYKGKIIDLDERNKLKLFFTVPRGNKIKKALSLIIGDVYLLIYMVTKIKKDETILVYHNLGFRNIINWAKKIVGFKVILEVEEIYQDVTSFPSFFNKIEYKTFESADKYIFSTGLLNQKINIKNLPCAIAHGTYQVEPNNKTRFDDGKVHVVYAGTFDPRKGGALAAAAAAEYLPKGYHVHIIGFGSEEDIIHIQEVIKEASPKNQAAITYDGLLKGEEYIQFLQKCDIGLSTQNPNAKFNQTSFPSKILSYMANGLRVVTVRIEVIEKSAVGNVLYYYDKQTAESIANAILSVNLEEPYDSRNLIKDLDIEFTNNIKKLLEN